MRREVRPCRLRSCAWCLCLAAVAVLPAHAQGVEQSDLPAPRIAASQRGFVEGRAVLFPQDGANDTVNLVSDFLAHDDLFVKPAAWLQFAG